MSRLNIFIIFNKKLRLDLRLKSSIPFCGISHEGWRWNDSGMFTHRNSTSKSLIFMRFHGAVTLKTWRPVCCYMCQMNPLIGPVLNQRALFAVKKFWVSVIGWTAVAQSTLASKTIIVCNCLIISAMDAVGISIASLLFLKLANPGLFSIYFCLYKHTLKIFTKNMNVKKFPSRIWIRTHNLWNMSLLP